MFKIAIDGPSGAGKSTISRRIAEKLNFKYYDTGAMYRAVTLKAMELGINLEDEKAYSFLDTMKLEVDGNKIYVDGIDVSETIRKVEITTNASTPSKIPLVRDWLVAYQRKQSYAYNCVMDGRDIGTVVLPDADLKIYLDATPECRAMRRRLERLANGIDISLEDTLEEMRIRDTKDSTRSYNPLKKADDAILIDSSNMSIDEVVERIIFLVNERSSKVMSEVKFFEGQEVQGVVTNVTKDAIYIELEGENKAVIYSNDLSNFAEGQKLRDYYFEGMEFKALVKQITKDSKTQQPVYVLSTKLYQAREQIKLFDELKENSTIIKAKVTNVSRIGADLVYDNINDIKLFLPVKNIDLSDKALYQLKGQLIDVIVTYVNHDRIQVTVSNSLAMSRLARKAREEALEKLEVGSVVEGEVVSVLDFGAIVNIGLLSGLLHRSELDYKMVKNVNDYVKVGDKINVKIIKIEDGKIGLSKKALFLHPWDALKEQYHEGDVFDGTITKIIEAGLIIKLTDQYSGLMPKSEYSWLINEKLDGKFAEGDTILVKVMNIDDAKKRISLSHRATKENQWANINLRKGSVIEVTIASIDEHGAVVTYKNVNGYLPIAEVTATKRIGKVDEMYKVGETVEASVLECNPARAKLLVSVKVLESSKEREEFDKYFKDQDKNTPTNTIADALGDALKKFEE